MLQVSRGARAVLQSRDSLARFLATLTEFVGDPESAAGVLPTNVKADDAAGSAFDASIVGYRDSLLFPFVHVGGAAAYTCVIERAFQADIRILYP